MNSCGFEKELSLALHDGRWPAACDPALRAHVAACTACSDLVLVTTTLQSARTAASHAAVLPPPGVLWWRAQVRRRNGAAERMSRPIVFAEAAAFLGALVAFAFFARQILSLFDFGSFSDSSALRDLGSLRDRFDLAQLISGLPAWMPLLIVVAVVVFFFAAGLAVYTVAHNE